jgi:uncharacterized protein YjbI with pentapeptide repeats/RecB family exonuclease
MYKNYSGRNLSRRNFRNADLRRCNFRNAILRYTNLSGADLTEADLTEANLQRANLNAANLKYADFTKAILSYANVSGADLSGADLHDSTHWNTNLTKANLGNANLKGAYLKDANLVGANLREADLIGADLSGANLTGADLSGTILDEHRDQDFKKEDSGNTDFKGLSLKDTNLTGTSHEESEHNQKLPKFAYDFDYGSSSINVAIMDRVVQIINGSYPEFDLKMESFYFQNQPHAVFTVAKEDFVQQAQEEVNNVIENQFEKQHDIFDNAIDETIKEPTSDIESSDAKKKNEDREFPTKSNINSTCDKCGPSSFFYDSYWKDYICENCGWIHANVNTNNKDSTTEKNITKPDSGRSPNQTSDYTFSFSKLNLFEKCPLSYKFKYILKKEEAFSTIEQHMGKCIHKALEYVYEKKRNGNQPPLDSIFEIFNQEWHGGDLESIKVVKSNMTAENYYSEGKKLLDSFFAHVLQIDKSITIDLEKNFAVELDSNFIYRGIIDRISKSKDNVLRITDFKTGKRVEDPEIDKQLQSYALWAFDTFEDNEIEVCFEDLRNAETKIAKISRDKASIIRENLLKDIRWVMKEQQFGPNPSILCGWCGYNPICDDALSFKTGKSSWNNGENDTGDECPRCKADLAERNGRYGSFIGCTDYPDCRYTRDEW